MATSWTERTPPSTTWEDRLKLEFLLQETFNKLLQESWDGILLEESINTLWEQRTQIS